MKSIATFLGRLNQHMCFSKPIGSKYTVVVVSADRCVATTYQMLLAGYLMHQCITHHPHLTQLFGPRLWAVRGMILVTPADLLAHRAVA